MISPREDRDERLRRGCVTRAQVGEECLGFGSEFPGLDARAAISKAFSRRTSMLMPVVRSRAARRSRNLHSTDVKVGGTLSADPVTSSRRAEYIAPHTISEEFKLAIPRPLVHAEVAVEGRDSGLLMDLGASDKTRVAREIGRFAYFLKSSSILVQCSPAAMAML